MRLSGRDHRRRDEAAGEAEQSDERPMAQRQADGDEGERRQHRESDGGLHQVIERDRREQTGIERGDARSRQRLSDGRRFAPHEVAGDQQRNPEQENKHDLHAGAQQSFFDRIFDQEEAGERDAGAAEPDEAARAQPLLEPARRRLDRGAQRRRGRGRLRCNDGSGFDRRCGGDRRFRLGRFNRRRDRFRRRLDRMRRAVRRVVGNGAAILQVPQLAAQQRKLLFEALGRAKGGDGERRNHEDEENPAREQDQSPQRPEQVQR